MSAKYRVIEALILIGTIGALWWVFLQGGATGFQAQWLAVLATIGIWGAVATKFRRFSIIRKIFPEGKPEDLDPDRSGITPESEDPRKHLRGGTWEGRGRTSAERSRSDPGDPRRHLK